MSHVPPTRQFGVAGRCAHAAVRFLSLFAVLLAGIVAAPAAHAATSPVTQADMCRAWSASLSGPKFSLSSGLDITATRAVRVGSSCLAPGAQIRLTGTKVTDPPGTPGTGTAAANILAAIERAATTDPSLKQGDELFKGAHLTNFNATLKLGYFEISGAINIDWTGGTVSRFIFKGKLYGVDKFAMTLTSPVGGTALPNLGGTNASYTGTLNLVGKHYTLNLTGSADHIVIGAGEKQLTVDNASIKLSLVDAADGQRLHADVAGKIGYGSSVIADGSVSLDYDDAGLSALSGTGALTATIPAKGSSPAGSITGNATFSYTKSPAAFAVAFTGDVKVGDALVANATGTLDQNSATFTGDASYTTDALTAKGKVDGVAFYGDTLTGLTVSNKAGTQVQATKGDLFLKAASADVTAKGLTVSGAAQIGLVGDSQWVTGSGAVDLTFSVASAADTNLKGSASVDWTVGQTPNVTFAGSVTSGSTVVANAKGAVDGKKLALSGDVALTNSDLTIKGAVDGTLWYGADLTGETVKNHSGATVAASKGDFVLKTASAQINTKGFALSGAVSLGRVGGERWATGSGAVDATYNGTNLKGSATIDWLAGGIPSVTFDGAVSSGGVQIASAKGSVDGNKLALTGAATLNSQGVTFKGAIDGVVFYGSDLSGQVITGRDGKDVQATKGDFLVKSASADVSAKGFALTGTAQVGSVGGAIWVKGGGNVDLTYGATNLKGSATIDWVAGSVPTVGFTGAMTSGTTTVANVSGTFDANKLSLKGDASLTDPSLTLKGAVDGVVYYGADLSGETAKNRAGASVQPVKGDFVLSSASGSVAIKNIALSGTMSLSKVAGSVFATAGGSVDVTNAGTRLKGTASVSWASGETPAVTFDGTVTSGDLTVAAKGTIDGQKLTLTGTAAYSNANVTAKGAVDGSVFYGSDLTGLKVTDRTGAQVQASQGDVSLKSASASLATKGLSLSGSATLGVVGGQAFIKGGGAVDFTAGAYHVTGTASVDWATGQPYSVSFSGSVASGDTLVANASGALDGNKVSFKGDASYTGSGVTVKGAAEGVVFYGADLIGETVIGHDGKAVAAKKGDFFIKSASANVVAKGFSLTGAASLGSTAGVVWVTGGGSVDLTYGATNLKGSATVDYVVGGTPSVSFSGSVTNGSTAVANASGTFDGAKIAIKGDVSLTDPAFTLKGAVDGVVYYGSDLSGEKVTNRAGAQVTPAKGDFVLKSASGSVVMKGLTITGNLAVASVAGDLWASAGGSVDYSTGSTSIKGSAMASWVAGQQPSVTFSGSIVSGDTAVANVSGTIDGKKITFKGDASLTNSSAALSGAVDGVVYYGSDLSGETVANHAGTKVQATKGDLVIKSASAKVTAKGITVTGAGSAGIVGSEKWVTGGGTIDATYGATNLKGSASIDWLAGTTPSVTFSGTVTSGDTVAASASGSFDGNKIALKADATLTGPQLTLKGAVDMVVYYGADLSGQTVTNKAGTTIPATKGDVTIKSASATVNTQGFAFTGAMSGGLLASQKWITASGSVDLTYGGTNLKGSANVDWLVGQTPSVAFSGSVTNGQTLVANASGVLDGAKIQLKGDVTATEGGTTVSGSVNGVLFYGNDLSGQTIADKTGAMVQPLKGDYNLAGLSGSVATAGLSASGTLVVGNVRGVKWAYGSGQVDLRFTQPGQPETRIQGSASADVNGNVQFSGSVSQGDTQLGSVSGTADGKKLVFDGALTTPTLSGKAHGTIWYGTSLSGETIVNRAGQTVGASRGDFQLDVTDGNIVLKQLIAKGGFTAKRVGTEWWVHAAAQVKVSQTWLTFTGDIDSAGNINLTGSGSVNFDGNIVSFKGTATVVNNALTITGSGTLTNGLFSATIAGTIQKPDMNVSQYVLTGTANFKFGTFSVANATVRLTFGEGLTTAFSIKTCFLFICPNATYKLYFTNGAISRAELNAPVAWVAQFLAIGSVAMPNVPISTTITGII